METPENRGYDLVQALARQALRQMPPVGGFVPPERFLVNITADEFMSGFNTLRNVLRGIYERIEAEPGVLGPVTFGGDTAEEAKKAETKALNIFRSVFIILAAAAEGAPDGEWVLAACGKKPFNEKAVCLLKASGFAMSGGKNDLIARVGFPSCPAVITALRSFAGALTDHLILCDWRALLYERGSVPYGYEDAERAIVNEGERIIYKAADEKLTGIGFTRAVHNSGLFSWAVKYFYEKERKETAVFHMERDGSFILNVRPLNVASYSRRFGELNERVRRLCLDGADCRFCGYCKTPHRFEYEGVKYVKCQIICCNFHFYGVSEEDAPSVLAVLDWEARVKTGLSQ